MKYVYWMSMDWNIYTQVNQNHFAIVLLWELERAYNTPPIIWKLGFFYTHRVFWLFETTLGHDGPTSFYEKRRENCDHLKEKHLGNTYVLYYNYGNNSIWVHILSGYICEVLSLLHTIHYNHYVLHYIRACNVVCKISN